MESEKKKNTHGKRGKQVQRKQISTKSNEFIVLEVP
jgi:hypothetical protein